jgi:hypothetical protein
MYFGETTDKTESIVSIVSMHYESFSVENGIGFWQGEREVLVKVTILSDKDETHDFKYMADRVKRLMGQESVLVTIDRVEAEFI